VLCLLPAASHAPHLHLIPFAWPATMPPPPRHMPSPTPLAPTPRMSPPHCTQPSPTSPSPHLHHSLRAPQVPYCPHLPQLFFGEELYQLVRMWSRGWDVYAPAATCLAHQWERGAREASWQKDTGPREASWQKDTGRTQGSSAIASSSSGAVSSAGGAAGSQQEAVELGSSGAHGGKAGPSTQHADTAAAGSTAPHEPGSGEPAAAEAEAAAAASAAAKAQQRRESQHRVLAMLRGEGQAGQHGQQAGTDGWGVGQRWGLGTQRSLQQWCEHLGVDFCSRAVSARARYGGRGQHEFAGPL
jgi:hypothetical protein